MNLSNFILAVVFASGAMAADKKHWSFQPVKRVAVPAKSNPIDYFIGRKLRENNLEHSPKADRITLLRRASLDLTGLPPDPAAVKKFVEYPRTTEIAFAEAIDGLLASPHYGERWAQHWLDVVRYADTHGFEVNTPRPNAWPYRDYVIEAFNKDVPFDQFIREQIAGDQLGKDAATGFLMTAARLLPGQIGKDAESMRLARQDELSEIVINTSEAFLGLSVGCARCHDHKFDEISAKDYYSMQAFFSGVSYGERPIQPDNAEALRKEIEEIKARVREIDRAVAGFVPLARSGVERASVNALLNVERFAPVKARKVRFTIKKTNRLEPCIDELEIFDTQGNNIALATLGVKRSASGSKVSRTHQLEFINDGNFGNASSWMAGKTTGWVMLEFPAVQTIDRIVWARDRDGKYNDRLALEYVIEVTDDSGEWQVVADSTDRRSLIKIVNGIVRPGPERQGPIGFKNAYDGDVGTKTFTTNPGTTTAPQRSMLAFEKGAVHNLSHIRINDIAGNDNNGRLQQITVRVTTDTDADLAARTYSDVKNLSIEMFSGDANPPPKVVIKDNTIEHLDTAHDGFYSIVFDPVPGATGFELEWKNEGNFKHWTLREIEACSGAPNKPKNRKSITALDPKQLAKSKTLSLEKKKIESRLAEITKSQPVFGGKFGKPEPVHILKRGDAEQLQEEVAPTVLSALGDLTLAKDSPEADRRLTLANWIASAKNPLTARVAVNRIWQFHFGTGLVLTSSDFGRNGAKPSHPELLDWLAYEFIRNGAILNHLPIRVVGIGGGFEYGHNGATHYGLEDVGIMRVQPGMTVLAPADSRQTETILEETWDMKGPIYYRLGKNDKPIVPALEGKFDFNGVQKVKEGKDILVVSMGAIAVETAEAVEILNESGISCGHLVVSTLNPAPVEALVQALKDYSTVVTVEAHYVCGGLGSLICEVVAENNLNTRVIRAALKESPDGLTGSQNYLHEKYGISRDKIVETARDAVGALIS